ncbi:MAG: radical SAM family heme chaperone HemW [Cytophagales bacterium]
MAGIYIHIPFCRKACHYCDFHFSTSLKNVDEVYHAIIKELSDESRFFENNKIETLYFGGGTPSVFSAEQLESIIKTTEKNFNFDRTTAKEITLEANPDDLNVSYLKSLKEIGIQRLSIGVQSFDDEILSFLNRSHNSKEAIKSIENAINSGFKKLNVDFIYGIPGRKPGTIKKELDILENKEIQHLSMYALTIEEKTVFGNWKKKGRLKEKDEDEVVSEYREMKKLLSDWEFEQYEISNFAREGSYAMHNTNYWLGKKYLGIGPSAHSFDGESRRINPSNNALYINGVKSGTLNRNTELLSPSNIFNEMLMTGLRTKWGVDKFKIQNSELFPTIKAVLIAYINKGLIIEKSNAYILSENGKLLADQIASDLFVV